MAYKWRPSKAARAEFSGKMREVEAFCAEHGISASASNDSYYFTLNGKKYRVSNHTVEASNRGAYDGTTGEQRRELYHAKGREADTVYIHAGKTRLIQIYNDLTAGCALDGKGNRIACTEN